MININKINIFCGNCCRTLASCIKIVALSKFNTRVPKVASSEELVILGNGPSLNHTIGNSYGFLEDRRCLAVNFAANTELFFKLKPEFYVLADPHFFNVFDQPNVSALWEVIATKVDWNMTLYIPSGIKKNGKWYDDALSNTYIKIHQYNLTPVEGFCWFENWAFGAGLGMPRPRNVLIPSLMIGLRMQFKTIYVSGADHSWTKTLSVNDRNEVISVQPHFYKEDDAEQKRVKTDYLKYPLYEIMYSFYVAFKSYFTINRYAKSINAHIYNITPESFIDAFERKKID